jgi:polar amino acid transport system substrate-binding protein
VRTLFHVAVALILFAGQAVFAAELVILTENLPPLNYLENDVLVGPSVEIVQAIQKRVDSDEPIQVYPWARAYKRALVEENVILFGMTFTKDRKPKFKWVGPLATKRDILVARKDAGFRINSLEDARKVKRIGTLRDDTREILLKSYGFSNLESVSDEQLNAKKLALGRIDLWAYKIPGLRTVCDLAGVDHTQFVEVLHLRETKLMIAFSKNTSDAIVRQWQAAFDEISADGTILQIQKKWNRKLADDPFPQMAD